ncbi:MAG: thiamine pyrophosphate-binding protein [Deltaproteobacteria bacterium]
MYEEEDEETYEGLSWSRRTFMQATVAASVLAASRAALAKKTAGTAAAYIARQLARHGATTLFGVPGATCDPLFEACHGNPKMSLAITSSDLEAGYAADGFARMRGLSALSVTYGVGTMSLMSVVAGAYAERSPIVVFNGGPHGTDLRLQRDFDTYFSHSNGHASSDLEMFRRITAYAKRAERAKDVPRVVDEAIRVALQQRRPVYVEIPKSLWTARVSATGETIDGRVAASGKEAQVAERIVDVLAKAKRPALLLGVELERYGLHEETKRLVEHLGVPYATTMLAKTVLAEGAPLFAGVYVGGRSVPAMRKFLEGADAVLALGCVFGRQYRTVATKSANLVAVSNGRARFGLGKKATETPVALDALIDALLAKRFSKNTAHAATNPRRGRSFDERRASLSKRAAEGPLTYDGLLKTVSDRLRPEHVVLTDTSLMMYPAGDLDVRGRGAFVCNGVWQAIGFSAGAAAGVAIAAPDKKPIVICGDGGFQMTAQALSTIAKMKLPVTVIVVNNGHYGIEQFLLDRNYFDAGKGGIPYLDLNDWDYVGFARALGITNAKAVTTTEQLAAALSGDGPAFIDAKIARNDLPAQLRKA